MKLTFKSARKNLAEYISENEITDSKVIIELVKAGKIFTVDNTNGHSYGINRCINFHKNGAVHIGSNSMTNFTAEGLPGVGNTLTFTDCEVVLTVDKAFVKSTIERNNATIESIKQANAAYEQLDGLMDKYGITEVTDNQVMALNVLMARDSGQEVSDILKAID